MVDSLCDRRCHRPGFSYEGNVDCMGHLGSDADLRGDGARACLGRRKALNCKKVEGFFYAAYS